MLKDAVAAGDILPAAEILAGLYATDPTHRDPALAAAAYESAAGAGSTGSMISLARMLTAGEETPTDPDRALKLLEQAIADGAVANGAEALAAFYLADTPHRDPLRAVAAYQMAVDAGNSWAMVKLARIFMRGKDVKPAFPRSVR